MPEETLRLTRTGSLILADNVIRAGGVLAPGEVDENAAGAHAFNEALAANRRATEGGNGAPRDDISSRPSRQEMRRAAAEKRAELAPLQQRIKRAEAAIGRLTQELARLDAALAAPDLYADPAKASGLAKDRADAARALAAAETDWLTASTEYEEAAAGL